MNFMLWLILVSSVCSNPLSESAWERTVRDSLPGDEEAASRRRLFSARLLSTPIGFPELEGEETISGGNEKRGNGKKATAPDSSLAKQG